MASNVRLGWNWSPDWTTQITACLLVNLFTFRYWTLWRAYFFFVLFLVFFSVLLFFCPAVRNIPTVYDSWTIATHFDIYCLCGTTIPGWKKWKPRLTIAQAAERKDRVLHEPLVVFTIPYFHRKIMLLMYGLGGLVSVRKETNEGQEAIQQRCHWNWKKDDSANASLSHIALKIDSFNEVDTGGGGVGGNVTSVQLNHISCWKI